MDRIVELLQEKNHFLEKFREINEAEILNFTEGNFENLESFYESRETILRAINHIEKMIESLHPFDIDEVDVQLKKAILKAMNYKNDLVTQILTQDLQILSCIEKAKSNLIKELAQVRSARKAVGAYKSGTSRKGLNAKY